MTGEAVNQIHGVAKILALGDPASWRRLLAEHTPDARGHCRSCFTSAGVSPVWPCGLRAIGEEAERLSAQAPQNRAQDRVQPLGRKPRPGV